MMMVVMMMIHITTSYASGDASQIATQAPPVEEAEEPVPVAGMLSEGF